MSDFQTTIICLVIPKFVRKKFAGVQQPLGRWILRHVLEFIVLSPAILLTWIWLKLRHKEILIIGQFASNISTFIASVEPELRKRLQNKSNMKKLIIINLSSDPNQELRKLYAKIVKFLSENQKIRRRIFWWTSKFGVKKVVSSEQIFSDPTWRIHSPSIELSEEINLDGDEFIQSLQISRGDPIICFATRTLSYYEMQGEIGFTVKAQTLRNPNESGYLKVAEYFCNKNFKVFRMGKYLEPVDVPHVNFIDYATNYRSDLWDILLLDRCRFLLSGGSGIFWFRALLNKNSVISDIYEIRVTYFHGDLFVLQRIWLEMENRIATFKEMLLMPGYSEEKHQKRFGMRLVKNSVSEIQAVCNEMNARIDGTWVTTDEDEVLQRRYQELILKYSNRPEWNGGGRVGTQFLRDNQDLLR